MPILKGIEPSLLSFSGFEVMLVLTAYMSKPKESNKALIWSMIITTIFYVVTIFMVVGGLSIDGVITHTWPTLDLVRSYEIEGLVFERFESFFLIFWIMKIFTTYVIKHYTATIALRDLFGIKNVQFVMYALVPIIYLVTFIPHDLEETFAFGDLLGTASIYLFGGFPLLLLTLSFLLKKGKSTSQSKA